MGQASSAWSVGQPRLEERSHPELTVIPSGIQRLGNLLLALDVVTQGGHWEWLSINYFTWSEFFEVRVQQALSGGKKQEVNTVTISLKSIFSESFF